MRMERPQRLELIQYESAYLTLFITPVTVTLANFHATEPGQGHGTKCMELAIQWADIHGRTMRLKVNKSGQDGPNNDKLVEFYKRFGFVEDSSWAGQMPIRMIRVVR